MIGYVTIGADDLDVVAAFYDEVFAAIGDERKPPVNDWIVYGRKGDEASVGICKPVKGEPTGSGNGVILAFSSISKAAVDSAYEAGLPRGGVSEGAPGYRPPDGATSYGCYLRDPTGNKICIFYE